MHAAEWFAAGATVLSILSLVVSALLYRVNARMARANEIMAEAAQSGVEIARSLADLEQTKRAESRKACLVLLNRPSLTPQARLGALPVTTSPASPGDAGDRRRSVALSIRNDGTYPAFGIAVRKGEEIVEALPDLTLDPGVGHTVSLGFGNDSNFQDDVDLRSLAWLVGVPVFAPQIPMPDVDGSSPASDAAWKVYEQEEERVTAELQQAISEWKRDSSKTTISIEWVDGLGRDSLTVDLRFVWFDEKPIFNQRFEILVEGQHSSDLCRYSQKPMEWTG